jgi:hypothetical protein
MTETICRQCKHLHSPAPAGKAYLWLCMANPITVRTNFVDGSGTEPYARCQSMNPVGECAKYEEGPNQYNIREPQ